LIAIITALIKLKEEKCKVLKPTSKRYQQSQAEALFSFGSLPLQI